MSWRSAHRELGGEGLGCLGRAAASSRGYEIPQSRERIRGRDRYLRFNQEYPGDWHLRPKVTIADERHGVVWFEWLLDGRSETRWYSLSSLTG